MELLVENMCFYPKKGKIPFQKGILCGIRAIRDLFKEVKAEGWTYILTARLKQDIVENLFSQLRGLGGADNHPDRIQVRLLYRVSQKKRSLGIYGPRNSIKRAENGS